MKLTTVRILKEDIEGGDCYKSTCPAARAIQRVTKDKRIMVDYYQINSGRKIFNYSIIETLFIALYDFTGVFMLHGIRIPSDWILKEMPETPKEAPISTMKLNMEENYTKKPAMPQESYEYA